MDNRPQFISNFIELYRSYPCLWKVKDDCYHTKEDAYDKLLLYYKETIPSATIDMVKRKINNLKSSFRKELKKVKNQKSGSAADENYTSSLWYFDLMMFTADQEMPRHGIGSDINEADQNETFCEDETSQSSPSTAHSSSHSPLPPLPSSPSAAHSSSHSPLPPLPSSPSTVHSSSHSPLPQSTSSVSSKIPSTNKRKNILINEAYKALKEDDEYDGIGLNVACKLRRMNDEQRLHAELLINKIILYGIKNRLQEETNISNLVPTQSQHLSRAAPTPTGTSQSILQLSPVEIETADAVMMIEDDLSQFVVFK